MLNVDALSQRAGGARCLLPHARLMREVNHAIENAAWGGYRTEFYPTCDYKAVAQQMRETNWETGGMRAWRSLYALELAAASGSSLRKRG